MKVFNATKCSIIGNCFASLPQHKTWYLSYLLLLIFLLNSKLHTTMTITQCQKIWIFNFSEKYFEKFKLIYDTAGIDNISGKFLKDGAIKTPIFAIFVSNSTPFQEVAKLLKLNHFLKKALRSFLKITALCHIPLCYQKFWNDCSWPNRGVFE